MFLIVAAIAAMWLAQPRAGRLALAKWAVAAVSIALLLPNIGSSLWRWRPSNPPFFTTPEYRSVLRRGETVLVLPFGQFGISMLWQAETGMWFRMAGGYLEGARGGLSSKILCSPPSTAKSSRIPWSCAHSSRAGMWGPSSSILQSPSSGPRLSRR